MTILTTGIKGGSLVARQEIRTMMQDQELFTLYILAVDRLQRVDQADLLSWFQIGGIHGRPYIAYDGAGGVGNIGGYCTHSSILFPPWHRPYLALFEQALAKHVNDIANEYQGADKQRYQTAAQRFRIPYWDWALNADLPDVVSRQKQITLNTPQGSKTMNNPLYSYTFHPMYSDFGDGLPDEKMWESWRSTYRWPTNTTANALSNDDAMERNLDNNRLTLRDRTYNLLTQANSYEAFSNDGFMGPRTDPAFYDSLESIHGQIHGMTGRNGHMGVVDFAAFDPVFWLHHTNCDRIFALWQALNPQSYVVPKANQAGTFATKRGTVETLDSPLAPFWKSQGVYWTAAGVRDTRTLNYTYPELVNWANLDARTRSTRIRTDINAMYGRTAAWGAMNAGLFNVAPSVPVQKPPTTTFGTKPTGGTPAAPRVPATAAGAVPAAKVAETKDAPAPPAVAPGTGAAAQKPVKAPAPILDAAGIRRAMEAGAQAAKDKAAAAGTSGATMAKKAAEATPTPVASAVVSAGNVAGGVAQKAAAAVPAPVSAAASKTVGVAQAAAASLAAAIPSGQPSGAAKGRESFEIDTSGTKTGGKHYNEWIANIAVEKYAAKTTFFVYIFLGEFSSDPTKWGEDPNLVGTHVVFANNMNFTGCERCRDQAEQHKIVTGTIPLTGALGDRLGKDKVGALEPAEIVPYLKKELHWRIQNHDDKVIERTDMPSLKISVAHIPVALPENITEFPTWGSGQRDSAVTAGRPGGAADDDDD